MIITTIRKEEIDLGVKPIYSLTKPYAKGPYNISNEEEQRIRISEGCCNFCVYCGEGWENGSKPIYHEIPEIVRNKVSLYDMNLIYKDRCVEILDDLGRRRVNKKVVKYELQCGIDWRYMTQEKASALKRNRFQNIRWVWDYSYQDAYKHLDCLRSLIYAGYDPKTIQVFMICNWKIPMYECLQKLSTLAKWNVQVSNCWFDNQVGRDIKPVDWTAEEIEFFGQKCRDHNVEIRSNGIQTEYLRNKKQKRTIL